MEVYANGLAFNVVKGWLGEEGVDLDWSAWYGAEDETGAVRPGSYSLARVLLQAPSGFGTPF